MKALVVVGAVLALSLSPALAAKKGKGSAAKTAAPGQLQTTPGTAKNFAPGQLQTTPGTAKNFAPGQKNR